ncbi:group I truncated hemoglobin [Aurantiacibacter gilvus]|uniref:Group 1 truncated hemoglobin n=1 Tax=Aurantiacibacter gilvus TaxID=3139141 RepID=A0ABU9IF31_9SPHN
MAQQNSMFDKYGGFSVVSKIVLDLYERILDDDDLGPFFDDVEFAKIVDHQTKFVSSMMGGPASYTDVQIQKLHSHLPISEAHFDKLTTILTEVLRDHGVEDDDTQEIVGTFAARRGLVVNT